MSLKESTKKIHYGNRGQSLIRVNKDEYQNLYHLLSDVVWGW